MIIIENLEVVFKGFKLEINNLKIDTGSYQIIMGPSGVGKTVFLYTLTGFIKPESGKIYLNNIDITNYPPEKRGFTIVPEDYGLFPHKNVYDNISYGLKIKGYDNEYIKNKVNELARILEINGILNRMPKTLSAGEKQRVAIARALAIDPYVILLDEPLKSLDPRLHLKSINFLKNLHKKLGFTALHVTHNIIEAIELGDSIAYIENGRLVGKFSIEEFVESEYGKAYLDSLSPIVKVYKNIKI